MMCVMQLYREFGELRGGQVHTCLVELLTSKIFEKKNNLHEEEKDKEADKEYEEEKKNKKKKNKKNKNKNKNKTGSVNSQRL